MPRILRPSDVAEFRDRVCAAAVQLFAERGYDGFNMRELAARLGVSAMTAYRYFKDKNEILAAVRARAFARFADRLEAASDVSGTLEEKFSALGWAYAAFAREDQVHYGLMFDLSQPQTAPTPESQQEEQRIRAALARLLVDAGFFGGDPGLIGQVLWSSLHGIVALNLSGKLLDAEFDKVLSEAMHMLADACNSIVDFAPQTMSMHERSVFAAGKARNANLAPLAAAE